jgi:hypothetical protein
MLQKFLEILFTHNVIVLTEFEFICFIPFVAWVVPFTTMFLFFLLMKILNIIFEIINYFIG